MKIYVKLIICIYFISYKPQIMKDIYLIRHWESVWNMNSIKQWLIDYPLSKEWEKQIKAINLNLNPGAKLFSSPYLRALESAKIFAETHWINSDKIIIDDRLREWEIFNEKENYQLSKENRNKINPYVLRYPAEQKYWDGESFLDIHTRCCSFIQDIIVNSEAWEYIIFAHAWSINHLIYTFLFGNDQNSERHYDFITKFEHLKNWSITKISWLDNKYLIDFYNMTHYGKN